MTLEWTDGLGEPSCQTFLMHCYPDHMKENKG